MNIRAVLFDLDGTLADTAPDLGAALNRLLRALGQPEKALADIRPHASHGAAALLAFGMGITPEHPDYPGCAAAIWTNTKPATAKRVFCLTAFLNCWKRSTGAIWFGAS